MTIILRVGLYTPQLLNAARRLLCITQLRDNFFDVRIVHLPLQKLNMK